VTLPLVVRSAAALRRRLARGQGDIGFVPTMGALHAGHLSLVSRAKRENRRVVVSIFVNPTQFSPDEDFSTYPRDLNADRRLLESEGPVLVYAPSASDIYPAGFSTTVKVGASLGSVLEAVFRPGHFDGVATVVARLFALVGPQRAYFGLKDYQQYLVIKRMTADLGLPVALTGCPIVREDDGLAMSSRNRRLSRGQRSKAAVLNRALGHVAALAASGEASAARLRSAGIDALRKVPGLKIQYFELADAGTLAPIRRLDKAARVLAACTLGSVRLIDNRPVHPAFARAVPRLLKGPKNV